MASDDDYYLINDKSESQVNKQSLLLKDPVKEEEEKVSPHREDKDSKDLVKNSTLQRSRSLAAADREQSTSSSEFVVLKVQLESSEKKVQALIASNDDMRSEIARLTTTVQKLVDDNKAFQR